MTGLGWLKSWVSVSVTGHEPVEAPPPPPLSEWERYGRVLRLAAIAIALTGALALAGWYIFTGSYSDWAVVVVAGDYHAHDGGETEAFDNARRDVAADLRHIGFSADNVLQFSTRPERYTDTKPLQADAGTIANSLLELSSRTRGGCLLYFTSHGTPQGIVLGNKLLGPDILASIVDNTCGQRPAIIIVSACYSGVFVSSLEGPNRVVITAARADRTSFGCSQDDKYPYFDTCVLQSMGDVHGFPELGERVRDCVAVRERDTGVSPPSEPQVFVGQQAAADLPDWN